MGAYMTKNGYNLSGIKNHHVFNEIKKHLMSLGIKMPITNPQEIIEQLRDPYSDLSRKLNDKKYYENKEMNDHVFFHLINEIIKFEKILSDEDKKFIEKLLEAREGKEEISCLFRLCQEALDDQDIQEREAEAYLQELDRIMSEIKICDTNIFNLTAKREYHSKELHNAIQESTNIRTEIHIVVIPDIVRRCNDRINDLRNLAQETTDPAKKEELLKSIEEYQVALAKLSSISTPEQSNVSAFLNTYQQISKKLVDSAPEVEMQKFKAKIDEDISIIDNKFRGLEKRLIAVEANAQYHQAKIVEIDKQIDAEKDKRQLLEGRMHEIHDVIKKDYPNAIARAQEKMDDKKSDNNKTEDKKTDNDDNKYQFDI